MTDSEDTVPTLSGVENVEMETGIAGKQETLYRYFAATAVVAAYIGLGFLLHPDANAYLVLGMPITVLFQVFVARRPLHELWLVKGQVMKWDRGTILWLILFLIGPVQAVVSGFMAVDWAVTVYGFAAIIGAAGAAVAFRALGKTAILRLSFLLLLTIPVGLARLLIGLATKGQGIADAELGGRLLTEVESLLFYIPAVFVAEEVFFRGALDTYLHRDERGFGWKSAVYVSLLWGLWHTPIVHPLTWFVLLEILAAQLMLGLILSWLWRRDGNLAVNGTVHAIIDALRNALAV